MKTLLAVLSMIPGLTATPPLPPRTVTTDEYNDFEVTLVEKYAEENGIECASRADLCRHPEIIKVIADSIEELQADLAHYEKVKRFVLLPESFSMEKGELTNTLKVKRRVVYEKYAKEIEQMYAEVQ
jgi:long-chain acyl-CoA synthetase